MFNRIIFLLVIVSSLSSNLNRCAVCFQSFINIACRSYLFAARIKRFSRLHILIKPLNKKNNKLFMLWHNSCNANLALEVCMINNTVSPQMWCVKSIKGWFTYPRICKKFGLIRFPRICFPGIIHCDQEPLRLLNVIEDDCYFWVFYMAINSM